MTQLAFYLALAGGLYWYAAILNGDGARLHRRFRGLVASFLLYSAALATLQLDADPPRSWWYIIVNGAFLLSIWVWIVRTHHAIMRSRCSNESNAG